MVSTQIVCDECGAVKKDANHWFEIRIDKLPAPGVHPAMDMNSPNAYAYRLRLASSGVDVVGMNHPAQLPIADFDLCSEACVHQTVSKYLRGEFKT